MFVQILGSAAGGGFPQWNCNCVNCAGFRDGSLRAQARTQSSIALSDDGVNWVLCNASPDIRTQLQGFAPMQPGRALRDTGISAIILMDSQIDHTTGLLSLREGCPHQVWCTDMVHEDDCANPGIAQGSARLHRRKALQLGADIRRGVAQHPIVHRPVRRWRAPKVVR